MNKNIKVAIIGAGVSGLYMAKLLLAKGYIVTVFEAKDRIGGRIRMDTVGNQALDLGGHWIHKVGASSNSLLSVLNESKEPFLIDKDDTYITQMAGGEKNVTGRPIIVEQFIQYMKNTNFDIDQPLLKTLLEFSDSKILYDFANCSAADHGSSCETFSTLEYKKLLSSDHVEHHELQNKTMSEFINGYFASIPEECILLSTPVHSINYEHNTVSVKTEKGIIRFNKVIISVPISQLKDNKIKFNPSLPERKLRAFQKIGMGSGVKMFLFFNESILSQAIFNQKFAPYYLQKKMGSQYVIISLIMGKFMESYLRNKLEYLKSILNEISEISGTDVQPLLKNSIFHDWSREPFIEGTYSYSMTGIGVARDIASEPVLDTLFFIGEAMNTESSHASINGAMDTSYRLSLQF